MEEKLRDSLRPYVLDAMKVARIKDKHRREKEFHLVMLLVYSHASRNWREILDAWIKTHGEKKKSVVRDSYD